MIFKIISSHCLNCDSFYGMDSSHKFLCVTCRMYFLKYGVHHSYRSSVPFLESIWHRLEVEVVFKNRKSC